ncbi:hypothetical protein GBAR_LOCUS31882, partial [Geodia barretti]
MRLMCIAYSMAEEWTKMLKIPKFCLYMQSTVLYVFIGFFTHFLTVIMLIHCFPNLCIIKFICIGR